MGRQVSMVILIILIFAVGILQVTLQNQFFSSCVAVCGQLAGLFMSIPQVIKILVRKSADDLSLQSLILTYAMIIFLGAHSVVTHAAILVIINYACSGLSALIVLGLTLYLQTRKESYVKRN